jgi:hypothetical protein
LPKVIFNITFTKTFNVFASMQKRGASVGGFSEQNPVLGGAVCATPTPPKMAVFGLPKSRPSPLQKCAKNGVFGRKSVHFRPFCAQFCTKMTSFLRT